MRFLVLFGLVTAACASPQAPERRPLPSETPPLTRDPGAVRDEHQRPSTQPTGPERPGGQGPSAHGVQPRADGQPCLHASECQSGICEGEGCGAGLPGRCMPASRACTRDLRAYCGCDGKTFRSSGSCPGQRFASRGECPANGAGAGADASDAP